MPEARDQFDPFDCRSIALEKVQKANLDGKKFAVSAEIHNVLGGGTLVFVNYKDKDNEPDEDCVFCDEHDRASILTAEQLARRIVARFPATRWKLIASRASFSGLIALIIVGTISSLVLLKLFNRPGISFEVPLVMSSPLGVIIGFYFGRLAFGDRESLRESAVALILANEPTASNVKVTAIVRNFLGGVLAVTRCVLPKEPPKKGNTEWEQYVYMTDDEATVYDDMESLGYLAQAYQQPTWWSLVMSVTTFGGMIALVICVTLCYATLRSPGLSDPVPVLSNAFTTILAFYFGSQTKGASPRR